MISLKKKMLMAAGGAPNVDKLFSTVLATGANLQAAFDALPFVPDLYIGKNRAASASWTWRDRMRGLGNTVASDTTAAQSGFSAYSGTSNHLGYGVKRRRRFFDSFTYAGNSVAGRVIPHNAGSVGKVVIKRLDVAGAWVVRHAFANGELILNTTAAQTSSQGRITAISDSSFSVSDDAAVNANGGTYLVQVWGHDPSTSGIIQCGVYTGNGSSSGPTVTLGWEPQWLEIKRIAGGTGSWNIADNKRSPSNPKTTFAFYNLNSAESVNATWGVNFLASGFQPTSSNSEVNASGSTYAYKAIRRGAS